MISARFSDGNTNKRNSAYLGLDCAYLCEIERTESQMMVIQPIRVRFRRYGRDFANVVSNLGKSTYSGFDSTDLGET